MILNPSTEPLIEAEDKSIDFLIERAIAEDLPHGDLTTESLGVQVRMGHAELVAKQDFVLSGCPIFNSVLKRMAPELEYQWYFKSGDFVLNRQTLVSFKGNLIPLLKAERIALNFLGHLSGIATLTAHYCKKIQHTSCRILDTRKTTPGYRDLEKQAVLDGGGLNHRRNLSSSLLIKENHLKIFNDSITQTVHQIRQHTTSPITIECKSRKEVEEVIPLGVQKIMLDNMSLEEMKEVIPFIPKGVEIEATGNMTFDRLAAVAELGVHFISTGSITHSASCVDVSLLFEWQKL